MRAFIELEDIIAKRLGRGSFGFGQVSEVSQVEADELLRGAGCPPRQSTLDQRVPSSGDTIHNS